MEIYYCRYKMTMREYGQTYVRYYCVPGCIGPSCVTYLQIGNFLL